MEQLNLTDNTFIQHLAELHWRDRAKRPIDISDDGIERYRCPECGNWWHGHQMHFCSECGQRISYDLI